MNKLFLLLIMAIPSHVLSVEKKLNAEVDLTVVESSSEVYESLFEKRWSIYGSYSALDLWVPSKFGIVASYGDDLRSFELAYQSASLGFDYVFEDLGKLTDTRIHLTTRSYKWAGSFNIQYGMYYNSLSIDLGTNLLRFVNAQYDIVKVETVGAMFGLGNSWSWENGLSIRGDWFRVFYPLMVVGENTSFLDNTTNSGDRSDVQKAVDTIKSTPTLTLAHFEIGYRF